MSSYQRGRAEKQLEVPVSAAEFWAVLLDWPAVKQWMPPDVLRISKVELAPGHTPGKLPCTRLVYLDKDELPPGTDPAALPDIAPETLLYVDSDAYFLYYNIGVGTCEPAAGVGAFGMRNYLAMVEVNPLGEMRCQVRIAGRYDLPPPASVETVDGFLDYMYEHGIIKGIAEYAVRRSAAMQDIENHTSVGSKR